MSPMCAVLKTVSLPCFTSRFFLTPAHCGVPPPGGRVLLPQKGCTVWSTGLTLNAQKYTEIYEFYAGGKFVFCLNIGWMIQHSPFSNVCIFSIVIQIICDTQITIKKKGYLMLKYC